MTLLESTIALALGAAILATAVDVLAVAARGARDAQRAALASTRASVVSELIVRELANAKGSSIELPTPHSVRFRTVEGATVEGPVLGDAIEVSLEAGLLRRRGPNAETTLAASVEAFEVAWVGTSVRVLVAFSSREGCVRTVAPRNP